MPRIARDLDEIPPKAIYVLLALSEEHGMISLGVGEPDFDAPKEAIEAAKEALQSGMTHYTADPGLLELREAILEKTKRDNGFEFDPKSEIMVTSGTSAAVFGSVLATVNPGDEVILPAPAYLAYEPLVRFAGGKPVFVPAGEDREFIPDIQDIAETVTSKTSLMIICSPNNPTGMIWGTQSLKAIADLAVDKDFHVLSDELYERIVYNNHNALSIASLNDMKDHAITINGVSKSYAMTGFRVGWMIGSKTTIEAYRKIHQYSAICAPAISQIAAIAALNQSEYYVQNMVAEYDRRRRLLLEEFEKMPLVSTIGTKGSFYMFVNIKELVESHLDDMVEYLKSPANKSLMEKLPQIAVDWIKTPDSGSKITMLYLFAKAKTLTAPGIAFGPIGENFLRISFAQKYDLIKQALDMVADSIEQLE